MCVKKKKFDAFFSFFLFFLLLFFSFLCVFFLPVLSFFICSCFSFVFSSFPFFAVSNRGVVFFWGRLAFLPSSLLRSALRAFRVLHLPPLWKPARTVKKKPFAWETHTIKIWNYMSWCRSPPPLDVRLFLPLVVVVGGRVVAWLNLGWICLS